jgi:hypothetical protein
LFKVPEFIFIFIGCNILDIFSKNTAIRYFKDMLPVGKDLLQGTDRRTDGRAEKPVNLKVTYSHFINALAIEEYPGFQGDWS